MERITRKLTIKHNIGAFFMLCIVMFFIFILPLFLAIFDDKTNLLDFIKLLSMPYLSVITGWFIVLIIITSVQLIFFPTGYEKIYNEICNTSWLQELGFKDKEKKTIWKSYLSFKLRGNYENITFGLNSLYYSKEESFNFAEIFVDIVISEKLIEESYEWSYLHRDFRLAYFDDKKLTLSPQKLSKIVAMKDLTDDKLMWEHLNTFVKILNEIKYRDKKLVEYIA